MTKLNYLFIHVLATIENLKNTETREEGQGLVEYALILALVSVLLVASLTGLKTAIAGTFTTVVGAL